MFNTATQIFSNVGWGSPQQMKQAFKAGVHRRLGFTPAGINPSLRLQKNSVKKMIAISTLSTLAVTSHAQTCKTASITATTPSSRFQILNGGTEVKDSQTGLIWQRCSLGQAWDSTNNSCIGTATTHTWKEAVEKASALGNNYRLPNIKELQTLVEEACVNPAINSTIFPNTQSSYYWSASPGANYSDYAWDVDFYYGSAYYHNNKGSNLHVRAVRSSQ